MLFAAPPANAAELPAGAVVRCKLLNDLNSQFSTPARCDFMVINDVIGPDGKTAIPAGTSGFGTVTVKPAGGCGSAGYLTFSAVSLNVQGKYLPVDCTMRREGLSNAEWVIPVAIISGCFTGVGFFLLFVQGGDVAVPAGTEFDACTDGSLQY